MKSSHKKNQKKAQKAKQRKEQIKRAKIAEQKKKTFVRDISVEVRADFALQKYEEGDIRRQKKTCRRFYDKSRMMPTFSML